MTRTRSLISVFALMLLATSLTAKDCPATGGPKPGESPLTGRKQALNLKKNRETVPQDGDIDHKVTISKMLNSDDDSTLFDQAKGAVITGYIVDAKPEAGEACNCYAPDDAHHDIHIYVAPNPNVTSLSGCVVVEITPAVKKRRPDLNLAYFKELAKNKHKVQLTGWLTYDWEHVGMSLATHPDDEKAARGTVWELHPLTDVEDPESDAGDMIKPTSGSVTPSGPANDGGETMSESAKASTPKTPGQVLLSILLGALLGVTGQCIRIAVGLKKLNDASTSQEDFSSQFDVKKLVVSVLYGVVVGIAAGVLMAIQDMDKGWDKSTVLAVIAAGYAGVDFIEGIMSRSLPSSGGNAPQPKPAPAPQPAPQPAPTNVTGATPKDGGISQK